MSKIIRLETKRTELKLKKVKKAMIKNEGEVSYFRLKSIENALNKLSDCRFIKVGSDDERISKDNKFIPKINYESIEKIAKELEEE